MRVAIIGGGPIGMEAALYGAIAGFDVQLFERGRLAENVRQWGHVNVFTEWKRNRSPLAARLLKERGATLPAEETNSSGDELADYVTKLSGLEPLRGRIFPQTPVLQLGRERCLRSDFIGDNRRNEFPFRVLIQTPVGQRVEHFDAVIDASGVYATPNFAGNGGMPAVGEIELQNRIDYHIPDIDGAGNLPGRDTARYKGHHTLVIGSGHSAASTLRSIGALFDDPETRITWAVRRDVPEHGLPYTLIADDPSPHRDQLHRRANELAENARVDFRPRTVLDAVEADGKYLQATLSTFDGQTTHLETIRVDNIAAHTGFRPDKTLWQEIEVHVHPATDGPFVLATALIENNHRAGVGLSTGYAHKEEKNEAEKAKVPAIDKWKFAPDEPDLLDSGEPNFFVLGIKSYGRDAGFLMQNGFRQVRDTFKILSQNPELDLYDGALDL